MNLLRDTLPGVGLTILIAIPAWIIGGAFPIIGGPVLGILFGMMLAFWRRPAVLDEGVKYTSKKLLQYSIILLGFDMNLYSVFQVGSQTLTLMTFTLTVTFLTAFVAGKLLKIDSNTNILIGVGTAICGGSAIAATAPVIRANEEEVARAISTIFLFNVIAAFLFPFLGHILGMDDSAFGLWAGTAINDTSSVVAAGYTYSSDAGNLAVIVKLTRTLMIVPITFILAMYAARTSPREQGAGQGSHRYRMGKVFPWFILGFVAASLVNTFIPLPQGMGTSIAQIGKFVIIMAMAAIGLNTHVVKLVQGGVKPIVLGLLCWIALSAASLGIQHILSI